MGFIMDKDLTEQSIPIGEKLISNTFYLFLDWFALSIIGFFFWFASGKLLLPEAYGIVSTSVNLALLLGGASLLGLHLASWKLIAGYTVRKKNKKIVALTRFSLKFVIISNLVVLAMLFSLSPFLLTILKIPLSVLLLSGAILFSYSIATHFRYIIYGFQDMKKLMITDVMGQLSKLLVSIILTLLGFKFLGPLIGFLFGQVLIILSRIGSIPLKGTGGYIDKKYVMFNYALPGFIVGIGFLVFTNGQYVLLTALRTPEVTGLYTVAMLLTSFLVFVPTTLNSALLPITSQLSVERNAQIRQRKLIQLIIRYSLLMTLPLAILLLMFSKIAILLFSRVEYLSASSFFPVLIIGSVVYGIGGIFLDNIYAIGRPKVTRNIVILMTLTFLALSFPLIHFLSALGSALAYTISAILMTLMSFWYLRKTIHMSLPYYSIIKLLISIIISFGLFYLLMNLVQNIVFRLVLAFLSSLLYLIILVPLKFYTKDDMKILDFLERRIPFLNKQIVKLRDAMTKYAV